MEKLLQSIFFVFVAVATYMALWSWDKPQEYAAFKARYFQSATISVEDSLSPGEVVVTKPSKKVEATSVKRKSEKPFNLVKAIFITAMLSGMGLVIVMMLYVLRELRGTQSNSVPA
jgi:hypothetical protein